MEIPEKALELVGEAHAAGWKVYMEVRPTSALVCVELDDRTLNRRRVTANWSRGSWLDGYLFSENRSKPRKFRNAGEVRRLLKGEL